MAFFRSGKKGEDLYDYNGQATIQLRGSSGDIILGNDDGDDGGGVDGDLLINNKEGQRTIHLSGDSATARFGGGLGASGRATFFHKDEPNPGPDTKATIYINGDRGNIRLGGNGVSGNLAIFPSGVKGKDLYDYGSKARIHLKGSTGDILLSNADCAEEFDISETEAAEPGTVMVLGEDGALQQSRDAYDKRVVGVVSGAGDYRPGIVLDSKERSDKRKPIALVGKVYCKVDAQYGPIEIGDLLTPSHTAGHAMKPLDVQRAFGSVIGKALRPWPEGTGLIPILVALQ